MSSTRKQDPANRTFRQEAFASSAENERGALGNLVSARCQHLSDPEEIAVLWWLQQVSWRDGGLEKFAEEFSAIHFNGSAKSDQESCFRYASFEDIPESVLGNYLEAQHRRSLAPDLLRALVDPRERLNVNRPFIDSFWENLKAWRAREAKAACGKIVETEVTRQIFDELDFALESRSFVVIEGREGIGKSEAACNWAEQHPGRAIYVRLESGSDETSLYRSIAQKIGTACTYQRKAIEMRLRVQDALQAGHVMLVLDEAHFLWPQGQRCERSAPKRLDWLRTALVDFGVPIALISTPQLFAQQCERFRKGGWNANQIERRITRTAQLPEALSAADSLAVTRRYFPAIPLREAKRVAGVALLSLEYLSKISHIRKRVDFLMSRRPGVAELDIVRATLEEIAPSAPPPLAACKPVEPAMQGTRTTLSEPVTVPGNRLVRSPENIPILV